MNEKQLTRKLLKVFVFMVAWVVVYSVALVCFVPAWLAFLNLFLFASYVIVTGRELL